MLKQSEIMVLKRKKCIAVVNISTKIKKAYIYNCTKKVKYFLICCCYRQSLFNRFKILPCVLKHLFKR